MNPRIADVVFVLGLVLVGTTAMAAPRAPAPAASATPADPAAKDVSLEIRIDTSRALPYAGSGMGITAEFTNKSKKAVLYLAEQTTTLTLPPEMEGPFAPIYGRDAFFPSENDQWRANEKRPEGEKKDVIVAIQPGHSYRAAWVQNVAGERINNAKKDGAVKDDKVRDADKRVDSPWDDAWNQIRSDLRYVFFPPGDYKVFVQAKVGIDKSPLEAGYTTFSEVANVRVAAPQFVIIFGAVIGGLISWLLFPQGEEKSVPVSRSIHGLWTVVKKAWWYVYSICGACLLSAIVTVLMARLSESQFLVKVSVTDFWGAMVIGFVAQYLGKSALDKLIPGRPASRAPQPAPAPPRQLHELPVEHEAALRDGTHG